MADNNKFKVNDLKLGMNSEVHASELKPNEYSLAVNANIQSANGNFIKVTNEHSNLLCSRFKDGYVVIGILPIPTQNRTIYFITNPITGESEIGYINNISYDDKSDLQLDCDGCNSYLTEPLPLEQINQTEGCTYTTIVNADCLNFNIDYPIRSTYSIGYSPNNDQPNNVTVVYFTDYLNPRRYIELENLPYKILGYETECNVPIYSTELDCEKIKVVRDMTPPCIDIVDIISGGSLKAGVYEFAMAYSTAQGLPVTSYFQVTNPVSISDPRFVITINTDYVTDRAISLNISNLDLKFNYINLVVLKTINEVTSPFLVGTFFINSETFSYTYTGNNYDKELRISIDEILRRPAIYPLAKGVTTANKHLFWFGLQEQKEINLQPVVNNLRLKWQSVEANEGFYKNGVNTSKHVGYLRDEVYPFAIYFKLKNGFETAEFLISNNDADYYTKYPEDLIIPCSPSGNVLDVNKDLSDDRDPNIIEQPGCVPQTYSKLWQVYNTGINLGETCDYQNGGNVSGYIYEYFRCLTPQYRQCPSGYDCVNDPVPSCSGSCNPPSGYTLQSETTLTIREFNPSGVVNTYEASGSVDTPTPRLPAGTFVPSGCVSGDTYIATNIDCFNATIVGISSTPQCLLDPQYNQPFTYAYLGTVSAAINPAYDCDGNSILGGYYDNQVWFQFTASSTVHALKLGYNGNVPLNIEVWSVCPTPVPGNVPIACYNGVTSATGYYLLMGDEANGQIPLDPGTTYYIRLYNPDPSSMSSTDPVTFDDYCFGYATLCVLTPDPTGTTIIPIPGIYQKECVYISPPIPRTFNIDSECEFQVYQYGDFAYWESTDTYPNNPDVWGNLCGQPIRYHKFPECCISHIHNNVYEEIDGAPSNSSFATNNKIYPIGLRLDINDVKTILTQAVLQGLITPEEKLNIVGYGIKRGNRRNSKSIIAKGLLYDVWRTLALDGDGKPVNPQKFLYYSNYPYNDVTHFDGYITTFKDSNTYITFQYAPQGYKNGRYVFHSPNTSFDLPFLGTELKLETVEYGVSKGQYSEVLFHAPYTLLSGRAYSLAEGLAAVEVVFDATTAAYVAGDSPSVLGTGGGAIINYIIYFAISLATGFVLNQSRYTEAWAKLFKNMGSPENPAIYYNSVGKYNGYECVQNYCPFTSNYIKRSAITNSRYMFPGNYEFTDNNEFVRYNNFQRESSVYLSIDAYDEVGNFVPSKAFSTVTDINVNIPADNSRTYPRSTMPTVTTQSPNSFINVDLYSNVASYYGSVKNYIANQYGTPEQIEWIDTGYCGLIDWNDDTQTTVCDTIFGGDTFLNRFALKRKMPFFIQDRVNYPPNSDVQYSLLNNIGFTFKYFNSIPADPTSAQKFFSFTPPDVSFVLIPVDDDGNPRSFFYSRGRFFLQAYGIPYFICESDYNVDLRHGENELDKNFYPNVGDVVDWTQQYRVSISTDNYYFYNIDYSKQNKENPYYILRKDFKNSLIDFKSKYPNRTIYSPQGVPNWLSYSANDFYDFPIEDGELIALNGIEQDKVVARQEKSTKVFNAYITMESDLTNVQVSIGNMFATKPAEYYKSDLGFGGSTHYTFESTPYGHFFVNTQNPGIFQLGGNSLIDITKGKEGKVTMRSWFRENLPFNISKDFPEIDIDNNYKYFGIATVWDNKFDRLFVTKRDAKLNPQYKNKISYSNGLFYYNPSGNIAPSGNSQVVSIFDTEFFCNKSWTIAYSPIVDNWISFYSFTPNYYVGNELYFGSGINYSTNNISGEIGLWNHLLTNRSFQVYYGRLHPFIFEYSTEDKIVNDSLIYVQYQTDLLRYQTNLDYYVVQDKTFNKALIYNQNQSTGILNLTVAEKDNLQQLVSYPSLGNWSTNILVTNVENNWRFNMIEDKNAKNGHPILQYSCGFPYKDSNNSALNFNTPYVKQHMVGDYFSVRLINDKYSNYKFLLKPFISNQITSIT